MPTLYAALDDRVLVVRGQRRSHCAQGTQWDCTGRLHEFDIECLAASPERPERVFVGTVDSGLRRSTDGGETWHTVGEFTDRVTAVTVSPHDPSTVWVGTEPSGSLPNSPTLPAPETPVPPERSGLLLMIRSFPSSVISTRAVPPGSCRGSNVAMLMNRHQTVIRVPSEYTATVPIASCGVVESH